MKLFKILKEDISVNKDNVKGIVFLFFFRFSYLFSRGILLKIVGLPIRFIYKIIFIHLLGFDIPERTQIGYGLRILHGHSIIINPNAIIGNNVVIRHNTTIGNSYTRGPSPNIEDNVDIGANVVIIGDITIGRNSIIGAGSVVVKNIPPHSVVIGNPGRVIKRINSDD